MTKIKIVSDIHLELLKTPNDIFNRLFEHNPETILILAGDIGNPYTAIYFEMLKITSKYYYHVIIITGNHEYYNNDIEETDQYILNLSKLYLNVHFLQMNSIIIDNIYFLGCTLWSNCDIDYEDSINDFKKIKNFDVKKYIQLHYSHKNWLEKNIDNNRNTFVITHHLPSKLLINNQYKFHVLNSFFYTNLEYLVKQCKYWVSGHTHHYNKLFIDKCQCIVNPVGYENEITYYKNEIIHL